MANVLTSLAEGLIKVVKDTIHLKAMRKDDLQQLLRNNIEGHQRMKAILSNFTDREMNDWMKNSVLPAMKKSNNLCKGAWDDYLRNLRGKASQEEKKRALSSLAESNGVLAKLLEEISKHIDKLIEGQQVNVWNVRMSHLAILGILRQSGRVLNFTEYMYSYMSRLPSRNAGSIPRYRDKFLVDKSMDVAIIVSNLREKKGPYNFLQEVDTMRRKNADLVLGATGTFNFPGLARLSNYSPSFLDNLMSALSCLNIFSAALDAWDDYRLSKHNRNKEDKEWMEHHTALLRMDLEQMDPTSPEYARLVAIIQAYDEKIADYDKKILEFEMEE